MLPTEKTKQLWNSLYKVWNDAQFVHHRGSKSAARDRFTDHVFGLLERGAMEESDVALLREYQKRRGLPRLPLPGGGPPGDVDD
jgi:hypothetical protein